jgi:SulP family sulfate permease
MLLLIVQFVAPVAAYLPLPAMAGVLFLVAWGLVDFKHIRHILHSDRQEAAVLVATFLATLFLSLEFAICAGVLLALLLYLNRTSRPVIEDVKPAVGEGQYHFSAATGLPDCPQLKILRINGSIFFGAAHHVQHAMTEVDERTPSQKFLMLACPGVNFVDVAGGQVLAQEARRRRSLGGDLFLFGLRDGPVRALSKSGDLAELGGDHLLPMGVPNTLSAIVPNLDQAICASCQSRIFRQCPPQVQMQDIAA